MNRGKLIVISAPSGSGKTTIAKEIMKRNPTLVFSVSATTRAKRDGEVEGRDYFYLTEDEFLKKIDEGEFIEWEKLYGNYYGTLKQEVERTICNGKHMLFDVDVNGGLSIKRKYPDACLIFIKPPSIEALKQRLFGRRTENGTATTRRLDRVPMELEKGQEFEHQIVNDALDIAVEEVQNIVQTHLHE
ncbi:MAG: guanylate kinase [Ignavibacteriae bacterium]|nr:guanylate kinase [Ignavibacteriota bacterium]